MKKLCVILSVVVLVAAVLAGVFYVRTGNLNNDLTAVKADMETKTAELTSAKADVEAKAAEIATLTEQLTAAQGDAEAKAAEIATLTEQLTAAQNDAEAKAAELTEQLTAAQNMMKSSPACFGSHISDLTRCPASSALNPCKASVSFRYALP